MKFKDFLISESEMLSSGAVIQTALDNVGMGLEKVRQTQTKENTKLTPYKENGIVVEALWMSEDGPMSKEGYSAQDGDSKLSKLIDAFEKEGGKVVKRGSLKLNDSSKIQFEDFKIVLSAVIINSSIDGNGFTRTYLKIITE